jgi:hypothetical protein
MGKEEIMGNYVRLGGRVPIYAVLFIHPLGTSAWCKAA